MAEYIFQLVMLVGLVFVVVNSQSYPQFEFRGNVLTNNSYIFRGNIGQNDSLHCVTDNSDCCYSNKWKKSFP